ncbi:hypothetical protein FQA39_LY04369 [Lamprigera yunnana]|nr:hypothetical protein FQA39_LY04369 [Lamprigera yunnana]
MENRRIFHFNNANDLAELQRILEQDYNNGSDECFGEEVDNESDAVSEREEDSETEQEGESDNSEGAAKHYVGKDNATLWRKRNTLRSLQKDVNISRVPYFSANYIMENRRIFYFNNANDLAELQRILEQDYDNGSDECFGEEVDNESDAVSEREEDSETEQEGESDNSEGAAKTLCRKR